jgi:N-acetylgalactosamine-N,N'-diacetylbacillosaminyl-diphospho-undecaprenol 4-alpha-N-acetylgalactosaminyltransferase
MKKNISILINSLNAGGAEKLVLLMVDDLKEDYNLCLILMNDTIKYDLKNFSNIYFLENSDLYESRILKLIKLPILGWKYKIFCKKNNIDTSISLLSRPNYISVISKIFGNKSKIVISEHSFPSKQYESHTIQSIINRFLIKNLYGLSDKIVAVSTGSAIDLREKFNIRKKIDVVPNSIDIEDIQSRMQEKIDFDFSRFTYITIGRLDVAKNHRMMINAFSKLEFDSQLLIIGEGDLTKDLFDLIGELNLKYKVFLLGYQNNPYKYLSRSNCFVLTSNYESFGIVLLEAMACGLPIISTDCESGPREILKTDQKYGILVPVNGIKSLTDAMTEIYNNEKLRDDYIQNNQEILNLFLNNSIGKKYL